MSEQTHASASKKCQWIEAEALATGLLAVCDYLHVAGGAMARIERVREEISAQPEADYWKRKSEAGWKLAAVEWTKEVEEGAALSDPAQEIPYGLRIAEDCAHLEVHPTEREALLLMLELIVQDRTLSQVAAELNGRGFRTRRGQEWGPASVFNMLPRMIEVGPNVFSQAEWATRRRRLIRAV